MEEFVVSNKTKCSSESKLLSALLNIFRGRMTLIMIWINILLNFVVANVWTQSCPVNHSYNYQQITVLSDELTSIVIANLHPYPLVCIVFKLKPLKTKQNRIIIKINVGLVRIMWVMKQKGIVFPNSNTFIYYDNSRKKYRNKNIWRWTNIFTTKISECII